MTLLSSEAAAGWSFRIWLPLIDTLTVYLVLVWTGGAPDAPDVPYFELKPWCKALHKG